MPFLSPPHRHLELRPGQPESVYVRRDFQITNVALGEELVDSNGRSVVKVTHSPINPVLLESDDEDSDDEDFDESEDEEDEEDESEDEVVQKTAKGGKKAAKEGKTVEEVSCDDVSCSCRRNCHSYVRNADPRAGHRQIEDDEDMEDDLSEGSDFSFDQPEATAVIAALTPGKVGRSRANSPFLHAVDKYIFCNRSNKSPPT
jgi:FK506-binding nuclear protein